MEKIIQLADSISGLDPTVDNGTTAEDSGVQLLATVMDDHLAEIALLYTPAFESVEEAAARNGIDPETIRQETVDLGQIGVLLYTDFDGVTKYQRVPWAPGIMEHLLLNKATQNAEVAKWFRIHTNNMTRLMGPNMPIGRGSLRAIPIGMAIEAEQHTATYEELKTYLDQSDLYSAADCACRMSAHLMGEACEHPYKDMCIQIGLEADYYIRSGRARQITREEAEAIIQKAERHGLVHQIFNNEGLNQSTFICNCCGCSCASLRSSTLFQSPDANRSNFVAQVDPEKCVACGACVENCNTNALMLGSAFCKENQVAERTALPHDTEWTEEYWNPDFKVRTMVNSYGTAPCKTACPAHISVQGYIRKAKEGKFDEALMLIKRDNPFPAICGRICPHNCEGECTRSKVDEAIAIDDIKKYIASKELESGSRYVPTIYERYDDKVAVIGAGPAGLSCAYYAALSGFQVTVFEKEEVLGGMMTLGIPSFRLEKDVINAEIDVLRQLGVQFQTGVEVGKAVTLDGLRAQGYKAFYLGIGAQAGRRLGIEGEDAQGVASGVDFLRQVNLGKAQNLSGKTVVIGGGNVAIDVARTALRMESSATSLYCLESREEMPALAEEQEEALGEGIEICASWGPKRILVSDGKVTGVEFKRCTSVFDEEGRFAPQYDENETITVACENVLVSVGQGMEWGDLLRGSQAVLSPRGTLEVDGMTLQSAQADVFAGGDAITGPKFAIDAIAAGKTGATSIKRFLLDQNMKVRREREYRPLDKANLDIEGFDRLPRQRIPEIDFEASRRTFKDLRDDLTDEQVAKETYRCLNCGISVVDEYLCLGCGVCSVKCEFDAIKLVRKTDIISADTAESFMEDIGTYMGQRAERIAAKNARS